MVATGVIHHVTNDYAFQNEHLFYRFRWDDKRPANLGAKVSADKKDQSLLLRDMLEKRLARSAVEHSTSFKKLAALEEPNKALPASI
mmetsp:Transcript_15732/g.34090  ORF Transcript_15732/g.34090 Transcript_15732/m.34090 type:complete len:87 (-) Transcript_15732:660-920(-)